MVIASCITLRVSSCRQGSSLAPIRNCIPDQGQTSLIGTWAGICFISDLSPSSSPDQINMKFFYINYFLRYIKIFLKSHFRGFQKISLYSRVLNLLRFPFKIYFLELFSGHMQIECVPRREFYCSTYICLHYSSFFKIGIWGNIRVLRMLKLGNNLPLHAPCCPPFHFWYKFIVHLPWYPTFHFA